MSQRRKRRQISGCCVLILLQKSQNTRRRFFEKNEAKLFSPFNMAPRPLAKPPVSLSLGDEVPHIFIRESHQRPRKKFDHGGKRLLQQDLPTASFLRRSRQRAILQPPWKHGSRATIECVPRSRIVPFLDVYVGRLGIGDDPLDWGGEYNLGNIPHCLKGTVFPPVAGRSACWSGESGRANFKANKWTGAHSRRMSRRATFWPSSTKYMQPTRPIKRQTTRRTCIQNCRSFWMSFMHCRMTNGSPW